MMQQRNKVPHLIICFLVFASVFAVYSVKWFLRSIVESSDESFKESWPFHLLLNILGYATVFLPGILIYKFVKSTKFLERAGPGCITRVVRVCLTGNSSERPTECDVAVGGHQAAAELRSPRQNALLLVFCFAGLQGSYLTWGVLQEKVMTQEYTDSYGGVSHFKDSQFLVLVNRILAFCMSGAYVAYSVQPHHTAPLYKYIFCSFSNIMSAWCQYEALKFVSFPMQVLAKASKIIPVMMMGKLVSRQTYEYYEYITACFITLGMAFFMLGSMDDHKGGVTVTTCSGVVLLAGYMLSDSFTSNWQAAIFTEYGVSSVQMMCSVNLFSCLFTAVALFQQGAFLQSTAFMIQYPKFIVDCALLSISSAAGQLFIFYTIATFGPVVFIIIMTIRQGLAILLSCVIYEHSISLLGVIGILIVFGSVFLRIYCSQRLRAIRRRMQASSMTKV